MNFLAHLHLAEPTPESRLGNLLGDFVRGYPWDDRYTGEIWQGIMEHRHVDSFTDRHAAWQKSRDLLPEELRRFAGIIIDIFYDFFLHRHWDRFSPGTSIGEFIQSVHDQLLEVIHLAPEEAAGAIHAMIDQNWLRAYSSIEGIDLTLRRVSSRNPILYPIADTSSLFVEHLSSMEEHFLEFYPALLLQMPEIRRQIHLERTEQD